MENGERVGGRGRREGGREREGRAIIPPNNITHTHTFVLLLSTNWRMKAETIVHTVHSGLDPVFGLDTARDCSNREGQNQHQKAFIYNLEASSSPINPKSRGNHFSACSQAFASTYIYINIMSKRQGTATQYYTHIHVKDYHFVHGGAVTELEHATDFIRILRWKGKNILTKSPNSSKFSEQSL